MFQEKLFHIYLEEDIILVPMLDVDTMLKIFQSWKMDLRTIAEEPFYLGLNFRIHQVMVMIAQDEINIFVRKRSKLFQ